MANKSDTSPEEDKKRKEIRKYFLGKPNLRLPFIGILIGGFAFLFTEYRLIGIVLVILACLWLIYQLRSTVSGPSDQTIDSWLLEDLVGLKSRSIQRLNLDESEFNRDPLVITGPILWETVGAPKDEVAYKKGKDGLVRFSINGVTIIHLGEHKLSSYQCDYNLIRGVPLNERDDEYFYNDVVAVATREVATNYTLPNNQVMKQAQSFALSVSSGEQIKVVVTSGEIEKLTGGQIVSTGVDDSIKAIRAILREKKIA